jgi:putative intracellular protease/amidase
MRIYILAVLMSIGIPFAAQAQSRGDVLVVVSSEHKLELRGGKRYDTGYYLNELAIPVRKLIDAGYTPVFANPLGNTPSMDVHSNDKMFFGGDDAKRAEIFEFVKSLKALKNPKTLKSIVAEGSDRFVGIFVPGGHAPMQDLLKDKDLGKILSSFHAAGKPTALICHGPIALLSTIPESSAFHDALVKQDGATIATLAKAWPYAGYRMTVFATSEEKAVEPNQLKGAVWFYPAEALAEAGAHVDSVAAWHNNVVQDRELITGQQPFSDGALGDLLVQALNARSANH